MEQHQSDSHINSSEEWVIVGAFQQPAHLTIGSQGKPCQCNHTDGSAMQLHLRPLFEAMHSCQPSTVLGMASFKAPSIGSTPKLSQLDIVAVIDRSGSMSGLRIELVKKAVGFISRHLRPGDHLALVSYSDAARIDLPLRLMNEEGQLQCSKALNNLSAGGCTNLGEGLLLGLGELGASNAPAAAMLLFTDGLANRGMTKTEDLLEAMRGPLSDMGSQSRAVFSFGLGTDHNAQMLFSLSDAGTGCYYYVDSAQAIAPSFADCLGGMLSVAAQDVTVTLRAKDGVSISSLSADFNVDLSEDRTYALIRMRDLSSDAEKEVLFNLDVPARDADADNYNLLTCTLSYNDVADGTARLRTADLILSALQDNEVAPTLNTTVEAHRCRLLAAKAMEQAAGMLNDAGTIDVRNVLSEALDALQKSPARAAADVRERIETLIADLSLCLERASDPRSCEKLCSSRAFAHKHQISTNAEGFEYRNALQQSLAEAARREVAFVLVQEAPLPLQASHSSSRNGGRAQFHPHSRASRAIGVCASANAGTIPAGAVRVGMRIICRGHPGVVQEITLSKTGKHGHAKAFFTVLGLDGIKRQDIVPSSHDVELAPDMGAINA